MQVLRIRASSVLALAFFVSLVVAGCKDGTGPQQKPEVALAPSGSVSVEAGDTFTVRATVSNSTRAEVDFSSSNTAVATVSAAGLVRALQAGETTISASVRGQPEASASLRVQVRAAPTGTVLIEGVVNALSLPVDPTRTQGVIFVDLNVERGRAAGLEVLLDSVVACRRTFTSTASQSRFGLVALVSAAPVRCDINTAAFDSTTGVPRFYNGATKLSARLVGADGGVLFTTTGPELVLRNGSVLLPSMGATRTAPDASGLTWLGGALSASVVPVIFDRNAGLARVEFVYSPPGGPVLTAADTAGPFAVVFPDSVLRGITDPGLVLSVRSVTRAGGVGPAAFTPLVRYDGERPTPGKLVAREWFGADVEFASAYSAQGEADRGVGRVRTRFFAVRGTGHSADSVISRGRQVARGSDLDEAVPGTYQLAALVCDALENCAALGGFSFGVDRGMPTLRSVTPADRTRNPAADLTVEPFDAFSGFGARPLEIATQLLDADPATATCGPVVEGLDLPGALKGGACAPDSLGGVVPIPRTTAGYYTYSVTPVDQAGNRGATVVLTYLLDLQPPSVSFGLPSQLTAGDEVQISAALDDNLDLTLADFRLVFPTADRTRTLAIPFVLPDTVGRAFDAQLTTTATATRRFPFVRTLTYAAVTPPRVTVLVDSLRVTAFDAAGLSRSMTRFVERERFGNDVSTSDPFPTVPGAPVVNATRVAVCTGSCSSATDPTTLPVTLSVTTNDATRPSPFARVFFYGISTQDGRVVYLGTQASSSADIRGTQATFTYSLEITPPAGLTGEYRIFGIGVSSRGNAFASDLNTQTVVRFYTG